MKIILFFVCVIGACAALVAFMIVMPGNGRPAPAPLTETGLVMKQALERHVRTLSEQIGPRSLGRYQALRKTADFIEEELTRSGYMPTRHLFTVRGDTVENLSAEVTGSREPKEILVIGAHYDTVGDDCPGANDNGSGVAAVLELARVFQKDTPEKTIRFVFFVNEEPPYFQTDEMGSLVYAKQLVRAKEKVFGMLSIETIGYYSDQSGSQQYPAPLHLAYPDRGDFIGFVSNVSSGLFQRQMLEHFRAHATIPSEGVSAPGFIPGIEWSDHWAFSAQGFNAVMVTDTAPFRYPHYHQTTDTYEKLDYERMSRVVLGLIECIRDVAGRAAA